MATGTSTMSNDALQKAIDQAHAHLDSTANEKAAVMFEEHLQKLLAEQARRAAERTG